jgi:uncharacterized protein
MAAFPFGFGDKRMSAQLQKQRDALANILRGHQRLLIAFSGGCDSSFLLAAAVKILGRENVLAVTAISASLPTHEKEFTRELAKSFNAPYRAIPTEELKNSSYTSNPSNRCFFCKEELFGKLAPIAEENRMRVADGFNVSDRADYRPGYQASQKWHVAHPLDEANLAKQDIRILSRWMCLPTWNKPASPCLSSRIPYGTAVTEKILRQIENAENAVRSEGFHVVRVRHYGDEARVEVPLKDLPRLKSPERWPRIVQNIQACGYESVLADPRGFASGRLNQPTEK